jgi:hypothetical protein
MRPRLGLFVPIGLVTALALGFAAIAVYTLSLALPALRAPAATAPRTRLPPSPVRLLVTSAPTAAAPTLTPTAPSSATAPASPTLAASATLAPSPASTPSLAPASPVAGPVTPAATLAGVRYAPLTGLSEHARAIFAYGQGLGNRAQVFSVVGDSLTTGLNYVTTHSAFLYRLGSGRYALGEYAELQPVLDYFTAVDAREGNSFVNLSLAAKGGWAAADVLNPNLSAAVCLPGEAPLNCEYRLVRPSVALIMLGTNDVRATPPERYEASLRAILEASINLGVIPVLSTLPTLQRDWAEGRVEPLNQIIVGLARAYDVPLWDFAAGLPALPNAGLSFDGVHLSTPPDGASADFTAENLQYGYTLRNLQALQILNALWRDLPLD